MSAVTWDGNWLAGPWLVREALDLAFERIADNPVMTIVIRRSAHIGCLAAYPRLATERNLMLLLSCSDPSVVDRGAAWRGGGPLHAEPDRGRLADRQHAGHLDVCPSTTTNGMVARMARTGERMAGPWLIDRAGNATDDPHVVMTRSPPARSCRSAEKISATKDMRSAFWARR